MVSPLQPVRITAAEAVDEYLELRHAGMLLGQYSPNSVQTYAQNLNFFLQALTSVHPEEGESTVLDDITGEDIDQILMAYARTPDRRKKQIAQTTAAKYRGTQKSIVSQQTFETTLKTFFGVAKTKRWVQDSPMAEEHRTLKVARKKASANPDRDPLTIAQLKAIVEYGPGDFADANTPKKELRWFCDRAILALMLRTGVRNSEVCKADREDFRPYIGPSGGANWVVHGKGSKTRELPISADVWSWITIWCEKRDKAIAEGTLPADTDKEAMFVSTWGNRINERYIQRLTKHVEERIRGHEDPEIAALARRFMPHTMRHTAATQALAAGADIKQVKEMLGHANISTSSVYLKRLDGELREVMDAVGTRFVDKSE